jgi:putative spermidine/putrescine transport system permease protein
MEYEGRAVTPRAAAIRSGNRRTGLLLALPATVFVALTFLVPVAILLASAFRTPSGAGFANVTTFFAEPLHLQVIWRTLRLAALVTVLSAVLGYVTALAIVGAGPRWRGVLIGALVLPLMISPVARTYAWIVVLGRTGLLNGVVLGLGLSNEPVRILFTETAVTIGLVQLFLPLMILSLVSALENLPKDVIPAARSLGASWWQVFRRVILPLTREGLVIGGTLVFTGALTAYITPAVLGGSKVLMLETLLVQRVNVANDIASAAVIALILVVTTIAANRLLGRLAGAGSTRG